ncbi:3'-5' exonuclease [Allonocardiopsis opalescens]|uniref:3'-5' exonuclease n=1 Tax=Allonocardiopsis opalescens TaxID=1144618 RepID=UPI0014741E2F|nr:3'-5' exonuclease [Allonocardiopsis opalescens]
METTGISPAGEHGVTEIAVIHVNAYGQPGDEWSTLVEPAGPSARMPVASPAGPHRTPPPFAAIAGDLAGLLADRVVVAHNLDFCVRFLVAEYDRLGIDVPLETGTGLCTLRMAREFLPEAGRSLRACCAAAGIEHHGVHHALATARATSGLLRHYLELAPAPPPWAQLLRTSRLLRWPRLRRNGTPPVHRGEVRAEAAHALSRLVDRLPRGEEPPDLDPYLDLVDHALVDPHISADADALDDTARYLRVSGTALATAHRHYLSALVRQASADGVLADAGREDLVRVTELLRIDRAALTDAVARARSGAGGEPVGPGGTRP